MIEVTKRDGRVVPFEEERIFRAVEKAFRETLSLSEDAVIDRASTNTIWDVVEDVKQSIQGNKITVEEIQDRVEYSLTRFNYPVAKKYILFRDKRASQRNKQEILVTNHKGETYKLTASHILLYFESLSYRVRDTSEKELSDAFLQAALPSMTDVDVDDLFIATARAKVEMEPSYSKVAARGVIYKTEAEALGVNSFTDHFHESVIEGEIPPSGFWPQEEFKDYLYEGVKNNLLDHRLTDGRYDLDELSEAINYDNDNNFEFLGAQTIYDRYLVKNKDRRIETHQWMWMRVAMGLALNEDDPTTRAIEFYTAMATFKLSPSTPTLFNSGTRSPQLSSCYLLTTEDSIEGIFSRLKDTAHLSKWAGGIGMDYTKLRGMNAYIEGINGYGGGVVPWLRLLNDTVAGVSQAGKRRGSGAAYMEIWHSDIEMFLDLRKNTGDERIRTHDLNTAVWVNDLFMDRVAQDGTWTLFSPDIVPDLHELVGKEFKERYEKYERLIPSDKKTVIRAKVLWKKLLSSLFETGHPWITFKDPSNIRYSNQHEGVVHSSNLCTEILLHTNEEEIAVCNLLSLNLPAYIKHGYLDENLLRDNVRTAMRMLDNVIDINFYPVPDAERSNKKHRPVGLGVMGFQDVLWLMGGIPYASAEAIDIADMLQEHVSYYAIEASSDLAVERGKYRTYEGSLWSKGKLPIDTINDMQESRETLLTMDLTQRLDWGTLRQKVLDQGMRNSNTMAIAPTATISNIQGVTQSIEPQFTNLFVKQNLSGTFTVVNSYLVADLKLHGLWDRDMLEEIKYWDGSIENIERIPVDIRLKYATAFEVEPEFLIEAASRRQKWIDMGQSLNLYIDQPSGKRLNDMYMLAWQYGLKTTYYLRAKGATSAEKSSIDVNKFGIRPRWSKTTSASSDIQIDRITKPKGEVTMLPMGDPIVEWVAGNSAGVSYGTSPLTKQLEVVVDPYEWSDDDICEACQ